MKMDEQSQHDDYMRRALHLASQAEGRTHPNPMVGCVAVKNHQIIAEGYHLRAGDHHAEVQALRCLAEKAQGHGADIYVTLEPCHHVGRTGPCSKALIEAQVGRVFVGMQDPDPRVNGRGIAALRAAGIDVEVGICQEACQHLNRAFVWAIEQHRPYVTAKIAQSLDGKVATYEGHSKWITSQAARQHGHTLRNRLDAIMVGVGTVLADDPLLTCRLVEGRDPLRVVLDSRARTPVTSQILQVAHSSIAETWLIVGEDSRDFAFEKYGHLSSVKVCAMPLLMGKIDLGAVLSLLWAEGFHSLLLEGGPTLLGAMFDAGFVNEIYCYTAPLIIGSQQARSSVGGLGVALLEKASRFKMLSWQKIGEDMLWVGQCLSL